jgi:nucleoside phosphorylase
MELRAVLAPTVTEVLPPCARPIERRPSILPRAVAWAPADAAPTEVPLSPRPSPDAPLPQADWLVITWTRDEHRALARVFTPTNPAGDETDFDKWYDYRMNFGSYAGDLRSQPFDPHPAIRSNRLGRFYLAKVGSKSVLLFKSELHLNQDGPRAYRQGRPLPLVRMTQQLVREVRPKYLISTGTAGGTVDDHNLGDTVITTAGVFHCNDPQDFRTADFNCKRFGIDYWVREALFSRAEQLMSTIQEHPIGVPHPRYPQAPLVDLPPLRPRIHQFRDLPIITTDFFEFGNTENRLDLIGCAVEMDDALIAKAIEELPVAQRPQYVFIRNVSDPVLNGKLDRSLQIMWAVYYYENFGILTSFNSALTTWAVIAGNP